jgi:hypothetical protein
MLPKTISPTVAPRVRVVPSSRWAELTTNSSQGEKRASELPWMAHADVNPSKRRVLPFGNFIVVRGDRWGKKVNLHATREIIGRLRTIKRGLTLGLPHPAVVIYSHKTRKLRRLCRKIFFGPHRFSSTSHLDRIHSPKGKT